MRLIDADEAVRLMGFEEYKYQFEENYGFRQAEKFIASLPPTTEAVPVKHGKWVKISPANIYECSKCGKNVMTNDISEYNFCHGCGADMRGNTTK